MTSLSRELGAEQDFHVFATTVAKRLAAVYDRDMVEASLSLV
jgi:hypothetical protein